MTRQRNPDAIEKTACEELADAIKTKRHFEQTTCKHVGLFRSGCHMTWSASVDT